MARESLQEMPANKYALLRYRIIDRCLKNTGKPYPSREDLRSACEEALYGSGGDAISLSTIDKDIWAMKNEGELGYYAPISFSRTHGGYFYEDPEYSISELSLGDDDLQALRFAVATLDQFKSVPIFSQYESAIEKLISRVNISPRPDEKGLDNYIQFERSSVAKGTEWLGELLESIKSKNIVEISYRKFQDNVLKQYLIHPYLLKEYDNRWYVIAWNEERKVTVTFGLERIEALKKQKSKFEIQKNFNPDLFFKYSIGITENTSSPEIVRVSFDAYAGRYLISQPLHPSQKIVEESPERVVLEWKILITEEVYSFILSHGNRAQVLSPEGLKGEIKSRLKQAITFY
ncbi:MAG: helix-turn-helix transcriptional regulator [Flavobacteriales bacterium]|jgi:predicted DNA-binding transcriptional regulator YafY